MPAFHIPLGGSLHYLLFFQGNAYTCVGIMVNFGSITTALLMSAVVMVYDQKSKIIEKREREKEKGENSVEDKIKTYTKNISLYKELCRNICFAILTSIIIVILSAILSFYDTSIKGFIYMSFFTLLSFFCYAFFISTMITFLMILKRFSIILDN
ncbi:hypothetical protein ACME8X_26810 (plasmid) [Klebsiella pneumoniae]